MSGRNHEEGIAGKRVGLVVVDDGVSREGVVAAVVGNGVPDTGVVVVTKPCFDEAGVELSEIDAGFVGVLEAESCEAVMLYARGGVGLARVVIDDEVVVMATLQRCDMEEGGIGVEEEAVVVDKKT